jgi:hypothetical protein
MFAHVQRQRLQGCDFESVPIIPDSVWLSGSPVQGGERSAYWEWYQKLHNITAWFDPAQHQSWLGLLVVPEHWRNLTEDEVVHIAMVTAFGLNMLHGSTDQMLDDLRRMITTGAAEDVTL